MVIARETARQKILWLQSRSVGDLFEVLTKSGGRKS